MFWSNKKKTWHLCWLQYTHREYYEEKGEMNEIHAYAVENTHYVGIELLVILAVLANHYYLSLISTLYIAYGRAFNVLCAVV